MAGKNQAIIIGHLGQDPTIRSGDRYTTVVLSVATTSSRKVDGEWQNDTEWHHVVLFGKAADAARGFKKGDLVFVEGKLQTKQWQDKNSGVTKSRTQITGYMTYKIDKMPVRVEYEPEEAPKEIPSHSSYEDIDDDDLPF